ncbi:cupin-like domain-containing protein [Xenorhabdus lircayensis]|uniref:Cupin-like domain-containing protein n=1 Tax=Xenorhabdus lircayensis TaxID=2763499 RepID=A0ABS0U1W2_9GAMM|nr:cupin-like domain-containing protein [Xenorhabdus lircayensis]MBI6547449.1 cupin-like domain-containing protein [Xenorhabdus lircayensis]
MSFFGNTWNALGDIAMWAHEEVSIYRRGKGTQRETESSDALARLESAEYRHVEKVSDISIAEFSKRYLMKKEPVIVTDGLRDWRGKQIWSFDYFAQEFGDMSVQLQDAGFQPNKVVELRAYLQEIASLPAVELGEMGADLDYLRYTYDSFFKHLLFTWGLGHRVKTHSFSFLAFQRIQDHWRRPYFLPESGYKIPWVQVGSLHPNKRMCQDWGLYFSAPGACTRLHVDGMRTNAVLCQVEGRKAGWIFSASLEDVVRNAAEGRADLSRYTNQSTHQANGGENQKSQHHNEDRIWQFDLLPGEIMLIPKGLSHEVHTLSPSISLTYNFLTNSEYRDYFNFKSQRGHGWIADAPIAAVPEFDILVMSKTKY